MLPRWCSFDNLKWILTTLLIPLTLFYLNQQYQEAQTKRQEFDARLQTDRQNTDARLRLYTELLSKREEADTSLRKGIFDKVLETYLKEAKNIDEKLVALELLTVNFNDSLDLSPLFWQLLREIQQKPQTANRPKLLERLERVSSQVKSRQLELLETFGDRADLNFSIEVLDVGADKAFEMERPIDRDFTFTDPDEIDPGQRSKTRHFAIYPLEYDSTGRRVFVSIDHGTAKGKTQRIQFWVDEYDFPLANFSRISKGERFAVVMRRYQPPNIGLSLIYFPSSRSGVKDKPFIDEVVTDLKRDVRK